MNISSDILQFVLNKYLNYNYDIPKLSIIINFKFNPKSHITVNEVINKLGIRFVTLYLDNKVIKQKCYYKNGNKYHFSIFRYKNSNIYITTTIWDKNGNKESKKKTKNKKLHGKSKIYENKVLICQEDYKDGKKHDFSKYLDTINNLIYGFKYDSGRIIGEMIKFNSF
jgi:antitoxin component YwqK of YwqJK toxin-antitoxin module